MWAKKHSDTKANWCARVRKKFEGIIDICQNENFDSLSVFQQVKERLQQERGEDWKRILQRENAIRGRGNNKLRLYRQHKLAGVAPLNIELGRYNGTPVENRMCPACHNDVEDELHVLFVYNHYKHLSKNLLDKANEYVDKFYNLALADQYNVIMSRSELQRACARTCYDILNERKRLTH